MPVTLLSINNTSSARLILRSTGQILLAKAYTPLEDIKTF